MPNGSSAATAYARQLPRTGHCAQICRACVAGLSLGGKKIPGSLAVQSACTLHTRLVSAAACSRSVG